MPYEYETNGAAIYEQSFRMIRAESDLTNFNALEEQVAVRMIHAAGLVDLAKYIKFSNGFVTKARAALNAGAPIFAMRAWSLRGSPAPVCLMQTKSYARCMIQIFTN